MVINWASVLTLWATVVPEVLGFEHEEALTFGRPVAALNAFPKGLPVGLSLGQKLGLFLLHGFIKRIHSAHHLLFA